MDEILLGYKKLYRETLTLTVSALFVFFIHFLLAVYSAMVENKIGVFIYSVFAIYFVFSGIHNHKKCKLFKLMYHERELYLNAFKTEIEGYKK